MARTLASLLSLLAVLLVLGDARADDDAGRALDEAERSLHDLRYEKAGAQLELALRSGANGPRELARLYRLRGRLAAALGDREGAEDAFARWLALEPDAGLAEGTSPKITGPFQAAAAELDGAGLRVDFRVDADDPSSIELEVLADPLTMVASARASCRGRADRAVVEAGRARLAISLPAGGLVAVAVLDPYGNRLVEHELTIPPRREAPPAPARAAPPPRPAPPPAAVVPPPRASDGPEFHQAWVWGGVAVGLGVVGGYYGWQARQDQRELDELTASSSEHSFLEAEAAADRLRSDSLIANSSFVLAGVCALTALLLWPEERPAAPRLRARAGRDASRVTMEWTW